MRTNVVVVTALGLALTGCQAGTADFANASLDTDDQKASYAIGLDMGGQLKPTEGHLDIPAMVAGIQDRMLEREQRISDEELRTVITSFNERLRAEVEEKRATDAAENQAAGAAFLAENGAKEGVTTTESGLQYEVLREGDGPMPSADDRVVLHYKGTLVDGTEFDSSYTAGQPATFPVTGVIPGFSEALLLMNVGSQYRVVIPSDIAYGPNGSGANIGPDATLVFEIELLEIADQAG